MTGRSGAAGFTLVGVVVAIAVLTILIAAVGPSIAAIMLRDKETELIFRGRQYARGIVLFQRRFGRLPTTMKELAESRPHTLRRLWKEPMCDCDNWHLIIAGTPEAVPPGPGAPTSGTFSGLGGRTPPPSGNRPPSTYTGIFSTTPPPGPGGGASAAPTPGFTSPFAPPNGQVIGPIIGVRSNVHKRGFQKWRELEYYDEWRFLAGDADRDLSNYIDPNTLRGIHFTPVPTP